mmetsp:Transcript_11196/g.24691  ORF Transcript_11196/g.24691 Transcript_11196/m.24691 type:complete len:244 (-) Transcript_11196:168-899(-)
MEHAHGACLDPLHFRGSHAGSAPRHIGSMKQILAVLAFLSHAHAASLLRGLCPSLSEMQIAQIAHATHPTRNCLCQLWSQGAFLFHCVHCFCPFLSSPASPASLASPASPASPSHFCPFSNHSNHSSLPSLPCGSSLLCQFLHLCLCWAALAAVLVEELVALAVEVEHWLQCHVLVELFELELEEPKANGQSQRLQRALEPEPLPGLLAEVAHFRHFCPPMKQARGQISMGFQDLVVLLRQAS